MKAILIRSSKFVVVTCIGKQAECGESFAIYADNKDGTLFRYTELSFIEGMPDWQAYRMETAKELLITFSKLHPDFVDNRGLYVGTAITITELLIYELKNKKMRCSRCGRELADAMNICPHCGQTVPGFYHNKKTGDYGYLDEFGAFTPYFKMKEPSRWKRLVPAMKRHATVMLLAGAGGKATRL